MTDTPNPATPPAVIDDIPLIAPLTTGFLPGNLYRKLPRAPETWVVQHLMPIGGLLNIYGNPKAGKAVNINEPILTVEKGWTTMEHVQPGDHVYGTSGQPTEVVAVSPITRNRTCYRVGFDDGNSVVVDAAHEWTISTKGDRLPCTLTTQQMVDRGIWRKDSSRYARAVYRVALPEAVTYPVGAPLPLDPYLLGMWLGDGTTSTGVITSSDPEILAGHEFHKVPSAKYGYRRPGFTNELDVLGVLNNKHIPRIYQEAAVEDRKALLAGLLDTDGGAEKGGAKFYNTNLTLVEQVIQLAWGLGYKVRVWERRAMVEGVDCGPMWTVSIRTHENPFRLARKAAKWRVNQERYRTITNIEPAPSVPVKCLVVDAPDHLFLVGRSFIPTHNSYAALQLASAVANESQDWMSFQIALWGPVCYLQLDTPRTIWGDRLDNTTAAGLDSDQVYFADSETAPYPFDILNQECYQWLQQWVFQIKPVMVIIDTLRELHSGDENDSMQMKNVISALVAATRPSALCLVSHAKKENMAIPEGQRESLLNDNRGSGYVAGRMDAIMRVSAGKGGKKGTLTYQGRTIEQKSLKIRRAEAGLWEVDGSELEAHIAQVLADRGLQNVSQRAEALSALSGRTFESCRGLLKRRAREAGPRVQLPVE